MILRVDSDVQLAAEFLQANFVAAKLLPIAEALAKLVPLLWERYDREAVVPLSLSYSGSMVSKDCQPPTD
jgi:hypothetical protein